MRKNQSPQPQNSMSKFYLYLLKHLRKVNDLIMDKERGCNSKSPKK